MSEKKEKAEKLGNGQPLPGSNILVSPGIGQKPRKKLVKPPIDIHVPGSLYPDCMDHRKQ